MEDPGDGTYIGNLVFRDGEVQYVRLERLISPDGVFTHNGTACWEEFTPRDPDPNANADGWYSLTAAGRLEATFEVGSYEADGSFIGDPEILPGQQGPDETHRIEGTVTWGDPNPEEPEAGTWHTLTADVSGSIAYAIGDSITLYGSRACIE